MATRGTRGIVSWLWTHIGTSGTGVGLHFRYLRRPTGLLWLRIMSPSHAEELRVENQGERLERTGEERARGESRSGKLMSVASAASFHEQVSSRSSRFNLDRADLKLSIQSTYLDPASDQGPSIAQVILDCIPETLECKAGNYPRSLSASDDFDRAHHSSRVCLWKRLMTTTRCIDYNQSTISFASPLPTRCSQLGSQSCGQDLPKPWYRDIPGRILLSNNSGCYCRNYRRSGDTIPCVITI